MNVELASHGDQAVLNVTLNCIEGRSPPLTVIVTTGSARDGPHNQLYYDGKGHLFRDLPTR